MENCIKHPFVAAANRLNNKGASLMYVLITLVFVGAIAMLVLNASRKETIDSSLRASTEMARFAATSGLNQATTWLSNPANDSANAPADARTVTNILQSWHTFWQSGTPAVPADRQWLFGGENNFVTDVNGARFRVQIVSADFSDMQQITRRVQRVGTTTPAQYRFQFEPDRHKELTATQNAAVLSHGTGTDQFFFLPLAHPENSRVTLLLRSESIDQSGSRATNTGTFTVFGFEPGEVEVERQQLPTHAFFLGGGNMWIHCPVVINGKTFIGNNVNSGISIYLTASTGATIRSEFNDEFRMIQGDSTQEAHLANAIFRGPAYFQGGRLMLVSPPAVNVIFEEGFGGNTAFRTHGGHTPQVLPGSSAVLAGSFNSAGGRLSMGNNTRLLHIDDAARFPANFYTGNPLVELRDTISNAEVLRQLNMSAEQPPAFNIDLRHIPENRIYDLPSPAISPFLGWATNPITGNHLQDWFRNPGQGGRPPLHVDTIGNSWLVIRTSTAAATHFGNGTVNFDGRAVIIITGTASGNASAGSGFPSVDTTQGVVLFYKQPSATSQQINYTGINGTFRGMFFNGCPRTHINLSAATGGWTANGAFYNAPGAVGSVIQFGAGAAGRITVNYRESVICEIAQLGVFGFIPNNAQCSTGDGDDDTDGMSIFRPIPRTLYPNTRTEMVNRSF